MDNLLDPLLLNNFYMDNFLDPLLLNNFLNPRLLNLILRARRWLNKIIYAQILLTINPQNINIYFGLRFDLANVINYYLGLKIRVVWGVFFLSINAYSLNSSYQNWVRFIFVYQKSLKLKFRTGFWVQIHDLQNLYSRVVNSQRLLCSQKSIIN